MALRISSKSTQYIKQQIAATENGATVDPTSLTVEMQLADPGSDPSDAAWVTADWETDTTSSPNRYFARVLVGPTGSGDIVSPDSGVRTLWVKIYDSPETPVLQGGNVVFT